MAKDHVEIRCSNCGRRMLIAWPTPRERHARATCPGCAMDFPLAEAVERTVVGAPDDRDLHLVRKKNDRSAYGPGA